MKILLKSPEILEFCSTFITFINQKIQSLEMPRLVSDFMTVQHIFMFWYVGVDGLDDSLRQT